MTDAGKVMITPKGEYDASETYEKYDNVSYSGVLYIALKTVTGIEPTDDGTNWMKWIDLGSVDVNSLAPTFTEATDRVNVMSGETIPTLFGKIKKWFADLKEVAFSGSYNDLSDTPEIPAAVSVKGDNETAYRTGEVNLTAEDIGAVATDGDTAENTVAFTSADSTTANAWTDVSALATGEKHSSILNKVSTMFKNIRYLYKMLGSTDISAIGDGTVTNALSTLNSNLNESLPTNMLNIGGKTVIVKDDEGINFKIYSADDSKVWEIDCYDNRSLRFYNILDDNVRAVIFTPEGDVVTSSGTSLNKLADHVNNQIISRTFSAVTTGGEASPLTAENVDGYNFLCWVGVASSGFIGTPYIENYEIQTTRIFDKNYYEGTDKNYLATALYIKS